MQLIDTHCHIDTGAFRDTLQATLRRSRAAGVICQIVPGICQQGWAHLLSLCEKEADLQPALGLHPLFIAQHQPHHLDELREHAQSGRIKAIGEIGLDFFNKTICPKEQQQLFEKQLDIAATARLPLLLHVRKAHDQVLSILRRISFDHGGIVHAYSGSRQQAERYIERGFKIGIGGTITYTRATKTRKLAATLPLDSLVLETDAPDLPPAAHRQQQNSPEYLPEILNTLASLRPESAQEIAATTSRTASRLFALDLTPSSSCPSGGHHQRTGGCKERSDGLVRGTGRRGANTGHIT